jgi:progressive ankylosis protein
LNVLNTKRELTQKTILAFWIPLAATWLMMSLEGPYLSALIARLAEPKFNLAAYGIAFSLALIIEAPVIMMMSASTALVKDYQSFKQLRKFNYILSASLTVAMMILVIPPIFYFITENLIGLPREVSYLTHLAVMILIPWPGAIGYRRFYQGILIRNNLTRLVAYGTIIRLISMTITAFMLFKFSNVPGVVVGASALSAAVICEAIASKIMVKKFLIKLKNQLNETQSELKIKEIIRFYYPLALTSILTLGIQPFVTFFIGQSRMPLESFAVMPVVTSFVFIFRGLGLSYQEVVVALIGDTMAGFEQLKRFAIKLAAFVAGTLMLIAFTPLAEIWFRDVSGLSESLTEFAKLPLMIMSFFPAFTVLISFQRAVLVKANETKQITYGTAIEFVGIIVVVAICIKFFSLVGAVAATIAFVIGRIAACGYLMPPTISSLKKANQLR